VMTALFLYFFVDKKRKSTQLFYEMEEETAREVHQFYQELEKIALCHRAWRCVAPVNAWAQSTPAGPGRPRRVCIRPRYKTPPYLQTNAKVFRIPLGKQTLYFFPDRVLIFERRKVTPLSYADLRVTQRNLHFVENGAPPPDCTAVGETQRQPRPRAKSLRRLPHRRPVLLYSELFFESKGKLAQRALFSRQNAGCAWSAFLKHYQKNPFCHP